MADVLQTAATHRPSATLGRMPLYTLAGSSRRGGDSTFFHRAIDATLPPPPQHLRVQTNSTPLLSTVGTASACQGAGNSICQRAASVNWSLLGMMLCGLRTSNDAGLLHLIHTGDKKESNLPLPGDLQSLPCRKRNTSVFPQA
ncbi:UNVERIFIED_CONTAM: hypothetical protein K2H54_026887 [Gekko kuhli]